MSPASASSGSSGSFSVSSGVFTAEKDGGVGNRGSGYTAMVDVQTLLEAF
jgi:hypothetical protein